MPGKQFQRFLARMQKRFGANLRDVEEIEGGGVRVRLVRPEERTGDKAMQMPFAIDPTTPRKAVGGGKRAEGDEGDDGEMDPESRLVSFSFSSEYPVLNWWGEGEILSHDPEDADLTRFAEVGSCLYNHNANLITGKPLRVWLDEDARKAYCEEEFGTTTMADNARHEVLVDKTLRGISVGFLVTEWIWLGSEDVSYKHIEGTEEGVWVGSKWQALEASHTPVPADPSVGVGRSALNGGTVPTEKTIVREDPRKARGAESMKIRMKLARSWTDADGVEHAAGEIVEMSREQAAELGKDVGTQVREQNPLPPANPPVDLAAVRAEAATQERARQTGIRALGTRFDVDVSAHIESGISESDARLAVLEAVGERSAKQGGASRVSIGTDERTKFFRAAGVGLAVRTGGKVDAAVEKEFGGRDLAGMTLLEMGAECLRMDGVTDLPTDRLERARLILDGRSVGIVRGNRTNEAINATTATFPALLANIASKELIVGMELANPTWPLWAKKGNLSDFKQAKRIQLSEAGLLPVVPEGDDYTAAKFSDKQESIILETRGQTFTISRQAIINDDLDAFTSIPRRLGMASGATVNFVAVQVLLANGLMQDGVALFAAGHNNLVAESDRALDSVDHARAGLAFLAKVIGQQVAMQHPDNAAAQKLYLNQKMNVVLVADELQAQYAMAAIGATNYGTGTEGVNPLRSYNLEIAVENNLANSTIPGFSATGYYGFVNPMASPVIEVAFLNGDEMPFLEETTNTGSAADGRTYKVRNDFGVAKVDWRGAALETGVDAA